MPDSRSQEISRLAAEVETLKIRLQKLQSRSKVDQLTGPLSPEELISFHPLTDLVHIETLQGLLDHFCEATGLTTGLLTPEGDLLAFSGKPARVCMELIRTTETGLHRCRAMLEKAREEHKSCFGPCHAGMFDGAVPIVVQGIIKGFLVIGQVLTEAPDREKALAYADELGIPGKEYWEALQEVAVVDAQHILSGARLLEFVGNQIANQAASTFILQQEVRTRKQTQRKLEEANTLLNAVLNGIPGYLNILDRDMNILNLNDNMLAVCGATGARGKVIGRKCHEVFHDTNVPCPQCLVPQVMESRKPASRETVPADSVMAAGREQKSYIAPIIDAGGEVIGAVEAIMDISDLKRTERALRESESRLRTIIDNAPVMIVSFDENLRFSLCNKECERKTGWSLKSLNDLSSPFEKLFPESDDLVRAYTQIRKVSGKFHEYNLRCFDDSIVTQAWANFRLPGGEFIAMGYDQTRTKQMEREILDSKEKAEAANRAKSTFLANMSHDLRTPINGIEGMLQLMIMNRLEPKQQRMAETALRSCNRLTRLLGDILDLSKVESGKMELQEEIFSIEEVRASILELFSRDAARKSLALEVAFAPDIPPWLRGDGSRLRQILNNLVTNALKFTEHGFVRIEASLAAGQPPDGATILFTVSDSGIGIPKTMLERIFNPFRQVDGSYSRKVGGAGLGLSIVKRLVDLMGGEISVESHPGQGSSFQCTLPFSPAGKPARQAGRKLDTSHDRYERRPRILLAEDDPVNRAAAGRMLEKMDCTVRTAVSGREALDRLQEETFDMVLMDIQMPVMDGLEATAAIRSDRAFASVRTIPIVALTAHAMAGDRERMLEAGMNDHLPKPLDFAALAAMVRKWSGPGDSETAAGI